MLMPTGPPALKLTALAEVNGSDEREKMSIAKFLTVSILYIGLATVLRVPSDILCCFTIAEFHRGWRAESVAGSHRQVDVEPM